MGPGGGISRRTAGSDSCFECLDLFAEGECPRHHCRLCGRVLCQRCCPTRRVAGGWVRLCEACWGVTHAASRHEAGVQALPGLLDAPQPPEEGGGRPRRLRRLIPGDEKDRARMSRKHAAQAQAALQRRLQGERAMYAALPRAVLEEFAVHVEREREEQLAELRGWFGAKMLRLRRALQQHETRGVQWFVGDLAPAFCTAAVLSGGVGAFLVREDAPRSRFVLYVNAGGDAGVLRYTMSRDARGLLRFGTQTMQCITDVVALLRRCTSGGGTAGCFGSSPPHPWHRGRRRAGL